MIAEIAQVSKALLWRVVEVVNPVGIQNIVRVEVDGLLLTPHIVADVAKVPFVIAARIHVVQGDLERAGAIFPRRHTRPGRRCRVNSPSLHASATRLRVKCVGASVGSEHGRGISGLRPGPERTRCTVSADTHSTIPHAAHCRTAVGLART